MLLEFLYREARGAPLVLELECSRCGERTRHYFDNYNSELVYECFVCGRLKVVEHHSLSKESEDKINDSNPVQDNQNT